MSISLRRLTRCAVLTALALALSVAEGLVPLTIIFPLPGLRLGLANLVTVYALCRLSGREALLILIARCLLGSLLGGNLMALAFSLTGGLLALAVMALLPWWCWVERPSGLPAAAAVLLPGHRRGHRRRVDPAGPPGTRFG